MEPMETAPGCNHCYERFPARIVLFRLFLYGLLFASAGVVLSWYRQAAMFGYWGWSLALILLVVATVCRHCRYHGKVCDTGLGIVAGKCFPEGGPDPERFVRAARIVILPFLLLLAMPLVVGIAAMANLPSASRVAVFALFCAASVAVIATTPLLACPRCKMNDTCPLGPRKYRA